MGQNSLVTVEAELAQNIFQRKETMTATAENIKDSNMFFQNTFFMTVIPQSNLAEKQREMLESSFHLQ